MHRILIIMKFIDSIFRKCKFTILQLRITKSYYLLRDHRQAFVP